MLIRDFIRLTTGSIKSQRMRSFLTGLGIAVGIAAVVFLTSIGEGLNRFVISEFTQFGTNLIGINPGRVTTMGTPLGVLGSVRLLTLGDVEALRRVPHAESVIPWIWGNAEVESGGKRLGGWGGGDGLGPEKHLVCIHDFRRVARGSAGLGRLQ